MMIINQLLLYYYIYIYLYYLWIFTMYMDRPERNPLVLSTRSMDLHQLKEEKPPRLQPVFNGLSTVSWWSWLSWWINDTGDG